VLFQSQDSSGGSRTLAERGRTTQQQNAIPQTPHTAASKGAAACKPTQADERRGRTIGKFHTTEWKESNSKNPHSITPATTSKGGRTLQQQVKEVTPCNKL